MFNGHSVLNITKLNDLKYFMFFNKSNIKTVTINKKKLSFFYFSGSLNILMLIQRPKKIDTVFLGHSVNRMKK